MASPAKCMQAFEYLPLSDSFDSSDMQASQDLPLSDTFDTSDVQASQDLPLSDTFDISDMQGSQDLPLSDTFDTSDMQSSQDLPLSEKSDTSDEERSDENSDDEYFDEELESEKEEEKCNCSSDEKEATGPKWQMLEGENCNFPKLPFTGKPGCKLNDDSVPINELGFFQLFFTVNILEYIVYETNKYAERRFQRMSFSQNSIWTKWKPVTMDEMKAYLGTIMNMALNDKPTIYGYFSRDWMDFMPFFLEVFPRNRFLQIHWMLHISSPSERETRASEVQVFLDLVRDKCLENFIPGRDIAIDESTIPFKGRAGCKTYNPQKPTKWGLRVYVLVDSATGYVSVFEPYLGKESTAALTRPDLPFASRIVIHLLGKLLPVANGTGFHLFTDRFYTGVQLALELLKMGIHLTGTVHRNRKDMAPELKRIKQLKHHEIEAYTLNEKVMALMWQDKRPVLMLSTYHDAGTMKVQKRGKRGERLLVQKPVVIESYTKRMGAVDRADKLCASYNFSRKSLKWWRKMFFWLLEVSICNSFILYNLSRQRNGQKPVSHLNYRKQLIRQLVGEVHNAGACPGRPCSGDVLVRLNQKPHLVDQLEKNKRRDCVVCSTRKTPGERSRTSYYCSTCPTKPALHPKDCFRLYHTKRHYKNGI